ncbi:signal-regulatory protein beta-2-like isoform X3 [Ahaetulla prasina]|uniref:signal-regulatory protein beta-2-like isoform X3 n=1 Tax=Ahaetulla prasina TaxID=499056 RepID=UPI002647799E|nr:signal-regulatory protein beta-2-like isoform X3 [Ahaetulla prasina]
MACGAFLSGLFFIVFSSLSSASNGGVKAKDPWLSQPQRSVSVIIGEVLHLECKVPDDPTPGGVKWYLGEGPQRKLIYADVEIDGKDERVTRNSPGSSTDFTISIRNVTLEDAGTYYCVKEKKGSGETTLKGPVIQVIVEGLRNSHTRSDFPEKQQPSKPTSGDKEIVYADLKDPSKLQIPRKIDSEERSEYATIKGAPSGATDIGAFCSLNL